MNMKSNFLVNLISNITSFVVSLFIGIWLTPFIIKNLGSDYYSFIPLTQQIIGYMGVVTVVFNGMISRFFTFSIYSGNNTEAEGYFNTSIVTTTIISLVLLIPLSLMTYYIDKLVNVPISILPEAKICMLISSIAFIVTTFCSPFNIAIFSTNRLDLNGYIGIANSIIRAFVIILLFLLLTPRIWFVAIGNIASVLIVSVVSIIIFFKLMPNIRISLRKFEFKKFKELTGAGIWNSINMVGTILFLQIDLLVANWYLGPKIAGEYSAVLQWSNLLRGIISVIVSIFGPTIVILYAQKKINEMITYSNKAVKITGIIIALPIGLVCGLGANILNIWISPEYSHYKWLLFLMTIHLSINLSVQPLFSISMASNRIKTPAIVTVIMGMFNFILAVLFVKFLNIGVYGIALAGTIVLTLKNFIFTPIYSAIITKQRINTYYKGIIIPIITTLTITLVCLMISSFINIENLYQLLLVILIVTFLYTIFTYLLMLSKDEKKSLKLLVSKNIKRV